MNFKILLKGIMGGICISIGGWLFICCRANLENGFLIGSLFFTVGLMLICNFDYFLYTGKVCFLFEKEEKNIKTKISELVIGLVGNFIGCLIMGFVLGLIAKESNEMIKYIITSISKAKSENSILKIFVASFFCGIFVFLAVKGFKSFENTILKHLCVLVCISSFILAGFEHCVANMFYMVVGGAFDSATIINLLLCIIGNSLGGLFLPIINYILKK